MKLSSVKSFFYPFLFKLFREAIRLAYRYKENSTDFVDIVMKELEVNSLNLVFVCLKCKINKSLTKVALVMKKKLVTTQVSSLFKFFLSTTYLVLLLAFPVFDVRFPRGWIWRFPGGYHQSVWKNFIISPCRTTNLQINLNKTSITNTKIYLNSPRSLS